jgi:hypothetical protein
MIGKVGMNKKSNWPINGKHNKKGKYVKLTCNRKLTCNNNSVKLTSYPNDQPDRTNLWITKNWESVNYQNVDSKLNPQNLVLKNYMLKIWKPGGVINL